MDNKTIDGGMTSILAAMTMIKDLLPIMEENMQKEELKEAHKKAEKLLNELRNGNKNN